VKRYNLQPPAVGRNQRFQTVYTHISKLIYISRRRSFNYGSKNTNTP